MRRFARFVAVVGLAFLAGTIPSAAEPRPLLIYLDGLSALESTLEAGDLATTRARARELLDTTVVLPDGSELAADATVLGPLAAAGSLEEARSLAPRIGALRRALAGSESVPSPEIDRELLERLRAADELDRPVGEGFDIGGEGSVLQAIGDLLRPVRDFLSKVWREFWEWLADLFRGKKSGGDGWLSGIDLPSLVKVLVIVFALALAVAAVRAWRQHGRPAVAAVAEIAAPGAADDDPLSRDEGGWRRYARELAAAGRTREAIRAWYHAVLVALYGRGFVTYRKGRTNWELIAALSPSLGFRPDLAELTRLFDREWYGLRQSPPEALDEVQELAQHLLGAIEPAGSTP